MTSSLQGKKVLVPRAKENAKSFSAIVEGFGGIPIEVPLLEFRATMNKEIDRIISSLHTYDWLILTSNVVVDTFFSLLNKEQMKQLPKIAVIGEKTKEVLTNRNIHVHFMPTSYVAESFSLEFANVVKGKERILLPKGNLARNYIAQFFQEKGHTVDEIIIYETYFPEESKEKLIQLLKAQQLDILPFTSPSTIDHFMSVVHEYNLQESIKKCVVAAIGPVSKKKCEEHGLTVQVMPKIYTSYEMITAVVHYLQQELGNLNK